MLLDLQYKILDIIMIQVYNVYQEKIKNILNILKFSLYYISFGLVIMCLLLINKIYLYIKLWYIKIKKEIERYPESILYNLIK